MPTKIRIPHQFQPREYQLPLLRALDSGHKRAVVVWHRRAGKDKTVLNLMIGKMLDRVGSYFYFFPTYNQGRKVLWDGIDKNGIRFLDHFPKELIDGEIHQQEMKIRLKNGSLFQIVGTDKVDHVVGTNPVGCIFSEYSLQNPQAWDLIRPILAENGGWAIFIFTPRGMNHGWKILQQAKEAGWFWEILDVDKTQTISKEVLDEERKQMPQSLFDQEYYCKFLEGAGQFFRRIKENVWDGELPAEHNHTYQLGIDLAKYQDWTVLTPIDLNTFKVGKQERFNQIDWNLQKARIEAVALRYNNARLRVDSTGVGDPIAEDLRNQGLNMDEDSAFKFTEISRRQLLDNLAMLLEQDMIKIPNDEGLIEELMSMQFELSERGKITVQVPSGMTDDRIMSLALAVWGLTKPLGTSMDNDYGIYGNQDFS